MNKIKNSIQSDIIQFELTQEELQLAITAANDSIIVEENPNYQESVKLKSITSGASVSYKYAYKSKIYSKVLELW